MMNARFRHQPGVGSAAVRPHRPGRLRAGATVAGMVALLLAACVPAAPPRPAATPLGSEAPAQLSPSAADAARQRSASTSGLVDRETGVQVVGVGVVLATPDLARIVFGVERLDAALDRALSSAASDMETVISRLVQLGVSRDEIKTVRFSVSPDYEQRGDQSVLRGYRVSNAVSATIHDLALAGRVIDGAVSAGATRVEAITFDTSRTAELKAQAREQAMADARAKAEQLAGLVGVALGPPVRIEESDASRPTPVRETASPMAATQATTPIEPGQLEIRTTISATWQLGNPAPASR